MARKGALSYGTCTHPGGCPRPAYGRTRLCSMHYQRLRSDGDIGEAGPRTHHGLSLQERWEASVNRDGAVPEYAPHLGCCYEWTHTKAVVGYGVLYWDGKVVYAHRVAYELFVGPIPDGMQIDHLCHVRICVRPSHLEAVTQRVNKSRGEGPAAVNARKTHCIHGLPFDEANTHWRNDGSRSCRTCEARSQRERVRTGK